MKIELVRKDKETGKLIPFAGTCRVTGAVLTERLCNEEFEIAQNNLKISFIGNQENLNFILEASEKVEVLVLKDNYSIFNGFFIPNVSTNLKQPVMFEFQLLDKSSIFDFQAKKEFVPYIELREPMFLLNSYQIEKSLLHRLVAFFEIPISLPVLELPELSFSFTIAEGENVLKKIQQLFREFNYIFSFDNLGIFRVKKLNSLIKPPEEEPDRKVLCFDIENAPFEKVVREFDNVKLSFSPVQFKSKEALKGESKALASKAGRVVPNPAFGDPDRPNEKEMIVEPAMKLVAGEIFPLGSEAEPQWTDFGKGFLNSNLRFNKDTKLWMGYKREEKDLSIIATMNHEAHVVADEGIEHHLQALSNKFCLRLENTTDKTEAVKFWDIFGDTIYRNSKVNIILKEEKEFYEPKEIFLEFVNTKADVLSFLNFYQSFFDFGNVSVEFLSPESFEVGDYIEINYDSIGISLRVLVTEKTIDLFDEIKQDGEVFFSYKAINFSKIKTYDYFEEHFHNEEKQEHVIFEITVTDIFQKKEALLKTDYLNDDDVFQSFNILFETYSAEIKLLKNSIFMINKELNIKGGTELEIQENVTIFKPILVEIQLQGFQNVLSYEGIASSKITGDVNIAKLDTKKADKFKFR